MAQVEKIAWVDPTKVGKRLDPGIASVESIRLGHRPPIEGTVVAVNFVEAEKPVHSDIPPTVITPAPPTVVPPVKSSATVFSLLAGAVGVVLVALLLWWILSPITQLAHVKAVQWNRELKLQQYIEVLSEGWILPTNARFVSQEYRISGYNSRISGYETKCTDRQEASHYSEYSHTITECSTDGNCKDTDIYTQKTDYQTIQDCKEEPIVEQDPIYDLWYSFWQWKWVDIQSLTTQGEGGEPFWPRFDSNNQYLQITNRIETHTITFDDGAGNFLPYSCSLDEYRRLSNQIGSLYLITSQFGKVTKIQRK